MLEELQELIPNKLDKDEKVEILSDGIFLKKNNVTVKSFEDIDSLKQFFREK